MIRKIKKILFLLPIMLILSFSVSASGTYNINYDYGVAVIHGEYIKNENPAKFSQGATLVLEDASCPGFEFKGWFTEPEYINEVEEIDGSVSSDITLYAKWYEMTYSVSYVLTTPGIELNAEEISHQNPTSRLAGESTYLLPPVCNSDRFTFVGWYTDAELTERIDYIKEYTCEDITLYAKWVNTAYGIQYDMGEISQSVYTTENPNPDSYRYNEQLTLLDPVTNDPAYFFDGWYEDEFFTKKITEIRKGTDGDLILYAKWNTAVNRINYVLADDSGINAESVHNNNPDTKSAAESLILSAPISDDKSFEFDGWYSSPDFSENTKIESLSANILGDLTVYAKWKKAIYNISYNYGIIDTKLCPVENTNPVTYEFGDSTALADISVDGFIFNGWCTDAALKNKVTGIPTDSYGDITLYADLTEKTYTISYILDYAEVTASQVVNSNKTIRTTTEQIYLEDAKTINTDYQFDGWYLDSECTREIRAVLAYTTGNINVYAKWIPKVVYVPCWGDATLSEQLSAADARLILRYSAGIETGFSELQKKVSDVTNDGKVNAADARIVLRMSAGADKEYDIKLEYSLPNIKVKDGEIVFS